MMAEYLSPGVYIEEFESGARPMSGVSTSIVGFVGMTQKGPDEGEPQLITSFGEFKRMYGGYLPEKIYWDFRYLSYAVEQFFYNGGSRCYVMRVALDDAKKANFYLPADPCRQVYNKTFFKAASKTIEKTTLSFTVNNDTSLALASTVDNKNDTFVLKTPLPDVYVNDLVFLKFTATNSGVAATTTIINTITEIANGNNQVTFKEALPSDWVTGLNNIAGIVFRFDLAVKREKATAATSYKGLSLSTLSPGHIETQLKNDPDVSVFIDQDKLTKTLQQLDATKDTPASLIDKITETGSVVTINAPESVLLIEAKNKGTWGNDITVTMSAAKKKNTTDTLCDINLKVTYNETTESYEGLSIDDSTPDYICKRLAKSELITATATDPPSGDEKTALTRVCEILLNSTSNTYTFQLAGGTDGSEKSLSGLSDPQNMVEAFNGGEQEPGKRKGINAFTDNGLISLLCAPGITHPVIQADVVNHCESFQNRFAILDIPKGHKSVSSIMTHRETVDSSFAAMYHPWLLMYDAFEKKDALFPPSGAVAGIYARTDQERGVHKAPANEVVRGAISLDCQYSQADQSILNPAGVNLIRTFPGQGIRVWGARTCSSNTLWKYVNVRRLFIFLEESIRQNTNWVVFEPNNELLWLRVQRTITVFLQDVWRSGALMGSTADEAFYVNIGRSTMTQSDIDNGRLICEIGVAPVKPAEFVIFRLTQKTMES